MDGNGLCFLVALPECYLTCSGIHPFIDQQPTIAAKLRKKVLISSSDFALVWLKMWDLHHLNSLCPFSFYSLGMKLKIKFHFVINAILICVLPSILSLYLSQFLMCSYHGDGCTGAFFDIILISLLYLVEPVSSTVLHALAFWDLFTYFNNGKVVGLLGPW